MARASKTKPAAKKQTKNITFGRLRRYNFMAAALLAVQGVLVLVLSSPQKGVRPIGAFFVTKDNLASNAAGHQVTATASQHLFDVNLACVVAAFFFISALVRLLIATWRRKTYESDLGRGINRARWIEYAFAAGTMLAAIAILGGVLDIASLAMIFVLVVVTSLLGMAMELRNQNEKRVDWASYNIGLLTGVTPWAITLLYIWISHVYGSGVPGFVYWIYFSLLVLFVGFALNMNFQYKKLGFWGNYLYGERVYILLSFITITVLGWQIFFGTLK